MWRIAADTPTFTADDLSGAGAKFAGGRWNAPGQAVVYTSVSRALACLETMVHLNVGGLPLNLYLVEIVIPEPIWAKAQRETASSLPVGWNAEPASATSIGYGSGWIAGSQSALLTLPSALVPEEYNILINPAHPDTCGLSARKVRKWLYDPRLRA